MHAHDRTLLASLGFADRDKQNPRHALACRYLCRPEVAEKLIDGLVEKTKLAVDVECVMGKLETEVAILKGEGQMVIITITGQPNLEERVRGVNEALKKYPGIKIVQTIDDKGDPRSAYDGISAIFAKKQKIDGIVCLEASGGAGAADALHRVDMTGKVAIVSFDKDPETFSWIDRGGINATVTQKPYVMAFYGLKFLDDLHHNAVHEFKDWRTAPAPSMPAWVDTGTAIVDKANLAAFKEALSAHPKPL